MENKNLKRGTLVTLDGDPFVVIRPDSDAMAEIYPGSEIPERLSGTDSRRRWVYSSRLTPRKPGDPATTDKTLEIVVALLREQAEFAKHMHGDGSPQWYATLNIGFGLADKLHPHKGAEHLALIHRMFKGI